MPIKNSPRSDAARATFALSGPNCRSLSAKALAYTGARVAGCAGDMIPSAESSVVGDGCRYLAVRLDGIRLRPRGS